MGYQLHLNPSPLHSGIYLTVRLLSSLLAVSLLQVSLQDHAGNQDPDLLVAWHSGRAVGVAEQLSLKINECSYENYSNKKCQ